ncbi:class I glutamine amidotransferase-like protein [Chlamydoabsidia padenii]|nr:class I glutamine amidotransferase-like protein [Chlamydoabsidia padenii]
MTNLHLALLVCDTPRPQVLEKYGDYPQMFSKVFNKAFGETGSLTWEFFDVVNKQEYPTDTSRFDGLVLTGSSASAYEDVPWIVKLVDFVRQQLNAPVKKKLVGICFGHQIIARAAGGKCAKNPNGWERLNQVHQDHVTELPPGFQSLATSAPHTPIHAMVSNDNQCITIQGHPEFNRDTVRILINLRADAGVISRDLAEKELAKLEHAGPDMEDTWLVAHFLDFIQGKLAHVAKV